MSDVSSTYTTQDTTLDSCQEYLGVEVSLADLAEMTNDEIAAYFEKLYTEAELTEDEEAAFETALQTDLDTYYEDISTTKDQLQGMLNSGNLSPAEVTSVEQLITDLDHWLELCDSDVMSGWGEGKSESAEKHVAVPAGETETLEPENPQDGDEYYIEVADSDDDSSGSSFNTDENANHIDTDGDGYKETNPDTNNDNIADDDFDGDDQITEADMTYGAAAETGIVLDLPDDATLSYVSYDSDTGLNRYKVVDGDVTYYILVPNDIIMYSSTIPDNIDSMPTDTLANCKESTSSEHTWYYHVYGSEPNVDGNYYTILDMTNYTALGGYTLEPSSEDYSQSREYTLNFSSSEDILNLTFDSTTTLEFSYEAGTTDGCYNITITATDVNGDTVIIHMNNVSMYDSINITGGTIDDSQASTLDHNFVSISSDTYDTTVTLGDIISVGGTAYSGRTQDEIDADIAEYEDYVASTTSA